jgi:transcriptional regulator with XRE-family HTH domain
MARMKSRGRETLGQRVRRIREDKKWTVKTVEENCGGKLTNGYVSQIENGQVVNLTKNKIIALAQGLQIPVSTLLEVMYDFALPIDPVEDEIISLFRRMKDQSKRLYLLLGHAMADFDAVISPTDAIKGTFKTDSKEHSDGGKARRIAKR